MIERLKNCPNCAGILDEAGRCQCCGSKVYDFLTFNFDSMGSNRPNAKTYIRVRSNGKISLLPILHIGCASISVNPETVCGYAFDGTYQVTRTRNKIELDLHLYCGNMVSVEEG